MSTHPTIGTAVSEQWREIPWLPGYEASDSGRLRSPRGRLLQPQADARTRYLRVHAGAKGLRRTYYVHRLVLAAFRGLPAPGQEAAHINGRRDDNRAENLAWVSRAENFSHKWLHRTMPAGTRSGQAKLTDAIVLACRERRAQGATYSSMALEYGVDRTTIRNACCGNRWRHLALWGPDGPAPSFRIESTNCPTPI